MKTLLLSCAVLAAAALTTTSASAEMLNQWLLDQFNASSGQRQSQVLAPIPAQDPSEAVKVNASLVQVPQEIKSDFQPAGVDAGQPAAPQPANSAPAPVK